MTLVEVIIALAIAGLTLAGIVEGYIYSTTAAVKAELVQAANARGDGTPRGDAKCPVGYGQLAGGGSVGGHEFSR